VTATLAAATGRRPRWLRTATLMVPPLLAWLLANGLSWSAADRDSFDYLLVRTHAAGTRATTSTSSATATPLAHCFPRRGSPFTPAGRAGLPGAGRGVPGRIYEHALFPVSLAVAAWDSAPGRA
jgi:hypothetical protein